MADFSWLNDVPEDEWEPASGGGVRKSFSLSWFLRKSEADPETWRREFDSWKFGQERVYESFHRPPFDGVELVMITAGQRQP